MSLSYVSGLTGEVVALDTADSLMGFQGDLASHDRNITITDAGIEGGYVNGVTVKAPYTGTFEQTDRLRRIADADFEAGVPGVMLKDGWERKAYIKGLSHSLMKHRSKSKAVITLLGGFWTRSKKQTFIAGLNIGGLDFPFDFPFDFSFMSGQGSLVNDTALEAMAKITFYGQCTNPYVVIGDNRYEVDYSAVAGAKIVIDFTGDEPTVMHYDQFGNGYSIVEHAVRTGGLDGGSYAFKPFRAGRSTVTWSGTFTIDVEWLERDTEVPWST